MIKVDNDKMREAYYSWQNKDKTQAKKTIFTSSKQKNRSISITDRKKAQDVFTVVFRYNHFKIFTRIKREPGRAGFRVYLKKIYFHTQRG